MFHKNFTQTVNTRKKVGVGFHEQRPSLYPLFGFNVLVYRSTKSRVQFNLAGKEVYVDHEKVAIVSESCVGCVNTIMTGYLVVHLEHLRNIWRKFLFHERMR